MKLLQPGFWYTKNIFTYVLYPVSFLYFVFSNILKLFKYEKKVSVPVICVGNLVMGGSGKTHTCIAIRKLINKYFKKTTVLTKGYRGYQKKSHLVRSDDDFRKVGDDALIHSLYGPVCVSKNRVEGANYCIKHKANLIILDDGLQSKHIHKDLTLLIVDGKQKFGNKKLFPAGPLRELLYYGLNRYDAIILVDIKECEFRQEFQSKIPLFQAKKEICINKTKKNVFAFCGIGFPQNFFNSLKDKGLNIVDRKVFGDHHIYNNNEIEEILRIAKLKKLDIITTQKDYLRINESYKKLIKYTKIEIIISEKKKLLSFVLQKIT